MLKILKIILLALPWFITGFIFRDVSYFDEINLPFFTIPKFVFPIAWTILYLLIAISTYYILDKNSLKDIKSYLKTLFINYLFNQLFMVIFFGLNNIFLGFVDTVCIFITSLFLYYETKEIHMHLSS